MVQPSFIPSPDIRDLRDLVRYRFKLTNIMTGEKNRVQNCLTVSNIKLDDVFSDVFGKSSMSITKYILDHPGESFDVTPFVDGRCKKTIEEIQDAVDGSISLEQAAKLREILCHIEELEVHKLNIESEILNLVVPYIHQLDLIHSVPGFSANPMTAIALISEIGVDMSVFPTAKHLSSWAGCCPRNDQSGNKRKSTRISRAGTYLKPLLVQVANAIVKSDKYPEFRDRYRRIKSRRGHKKAIIAICRMLLTAIWNILAKGEPYSPEGYLVDRFIPKGDSFITRAQALNYMRARGFVILDDKETPTVEAPA
jgi:hypothetical protein